MNESFKAAGINHQENKGGNNNTESLSLPLLLPSSSSSSSSSNKDDGEIAVLDDELPPLKKPRIVHPIEVASWDEVEVTLEAVNRVKKCGPARSRLVSISGTAIWKSTVEALRKFASNHLISKSRKMTKVQLCDAILDGKARNDKGLPDGGVILEMAVKKELPFPRDGKAKNDKGIPDDGVILEVAVNKEPPFPRIRSCRIRALLVAKKDCLKVPPETFHSWLVSQDIVTMAELREACEDDEFVAEEMRNGGLKAFKKKGFVRAVLAYSD